MQEEKEKVLTKEEIEEKAKEFKELWDKTVFSKLELVNGGIEYIPNGHGRRRVVFKTPIDGTILTMDEPSGKKALEQIDKWKYATKDDFDIGVTWITKIEYADNKTSSKGLSVIDLNAPDVNAGEQGRLIKEIESWGREELECISIAFCYLNQKIIFQDFFI
jgi:hypothetical protein